jgi:hypothetical protein
VFCKGRAVGDEAYTADDEQNAEPAGDGDMLMLPEVGEKRDDDVSEGGGREDKGEVGPGESSELAGEETEEQEDSGDDPRVFQGGEEEAETGEADGAYLRHAVGEEGVTDGGGEHDGQEDEIALGGEGVFHLKGEFCLRRMHSEDAGKSFAI